MGRWSFGSMHLGTSTNPVSEVVVGRNRRLVAGKGRFGRKLPRLMGFLAADLAVWADGARDGTSGGYAALLLDKSTEVVGEVGHPDAGAGSCQPDRANRQSHVLLLHREDMLDRCPVAGAPGIAAADVRWQRPAGRRARTAWCGPSARRSAPVSRRDHLRRVSYRLTVAASTPFVIVRRAIPTRTDCQLSAAARTGDVLRGLASVRGCRRGGPSGRRSLSRRGRTGRRRPCGRSAPCRLDGAA